MKHFKFTAKLIPLQLAWIPIFSALPNQQELVVPKIRPPLISP